MAMAFQMLKMPARTMPEHQHLRDAPTVIMITLLIKMITVPMYRDWQNIKAAPYLIQIMMVLMMNRINVLTLQV